MKLTQNYSLKKPDLSDVADIEVLNGNMDIIDTQFKNFSTLLDSKTNKNIEFIKPPLLNGCTEEWGSFGLYKTGNIVTAHLFIRVPKSNIKMFEIPVGWRPSKYIHFYTFGYTNFDGGEYGISSTYLVFSNENGLKFGVTPIKDVEGYNRMSNNNTIQPRYYSLLGHISYIVGN